MSVTCKRPLISRRSLIASATGLAASAAICNRAAAQMDDMGLPDAAEGWNAQAPAAPPALNFTDAAGRSLNLGMYHGHVLVVNIWATWCGPCTDELPSFAALAPRIKPFGGLVLPISIDVDGAQAVNPFYALHGLRGLPVLLDPNGDALDKLDSDGVPVTLVINPAGLLVARLDGAANWNTAAVLQYLQGLAPAPKAAPVFRAV